MRKIVVLFVIVLTYTAAAEIPVEGDQVRLNMVPDEIILHAIPVAAFDFVIENETSFRCKANHKGKQKYSVEFYQAYTLHEGKNEITYTAVGYDGLRGEPNTTVLVFEKPEPPPTPTPRPPARFRIESVELIE